MGPPLIVLTLTDGLPSCSTIGPRAMDALQVKTSMVDKTRETASGGRLSHQEKMRGLSAAHSITTAKLVIDYNKHYYWINGLEFVICDRDTENNRKYPCYDMSFWTNEGTVVDLTSMTIEVLPKEEVLKRLDERIHKWFNIQS